MPSELAIVELDAAGADLAALSGAEAKTCEWGSDWYASLPDIAALKGLESILDADSRRLERFSRREEAADRIVAMFILAGNLARIPRLDAQREATRLGWQAAQRTERFLLASRDPTLAARVREAIDGYTRDHEESMAKVVQTERIRWVSRPSDRIRLGEDGASLYRAAAAEDAATITKSNEYPLSRLSGEPLLVEMRAAEGYFDAVREAWGRPDSVARFAELGARADRGEFGAWIAAARPDFVRIVGELARTKGSVGELRTQVDAVANSAANPSP